MKTNETMFLFRREESWWTLWRAGENLMEKGVKRAD